MIGQDKIIERLDFKGPYIIIGPKGSGKSLLANEIAMQVICDEDIGCGECLSCKTFIHKNDPDYYYISGGSVDEVKDLISKIGIKSYKHRSIVVFDDFDNMTTQAQNLLLKVLENPRDVLFILTGSKVSKILKTIISRCFQISPILLSNDDIMKEIMKRCPDGEDIEYLNQIVSYSEGRLGVAFNMLEKKDFYLMLMGDTMQIKKKNFFEIANRYTKDYKDDTEEILNYYEYFIRSMMIDECINKSYKDSLFDILKQLLIYREQMNNNINKIMVYQNIIISLQKTV